MMERLTERDDMGCAWYKTTEAPSHQRIEAHAAYEDTGLTPDEITALRDQLDHAGMVLDAYKTDMAALKAEVERLRAAYEAPPTPLTLEELDAMNNEPVFIQTGDGQEFWFLADKEWQYELDVDPDFINMTCSFDKDGHFGLHVLGWQALRRKPK